MKTSWSRDIVEEKRQQYQGISLKISSCEKEPFRCYRLLRAADGGCGTLRVGYPSGNGSHQPSMTVERDPRATMAQQCSKGLILLKKQTTYLSKALILHAHEIGTFCIDCTGTPILLVNPKVPKIVPRICRYGRSRNMENPKPHQRPCRMEIDWPTVPPRFVRQSIEARSALL